MLEAYEEDDLGQGPSARQPAPSSPQPASSAPLTLKAMLEAYERQILESALAATNGNQRRAALALGLLPTTLHEKLKRLGMLQRAASRSG